ncbi:hypothetical protein K504DRAFT_488996 [Pleomassaria siparia CBS 279.74]|uniref:Uncharacterized protein n=1 Tax=Pleomassaria siparia CBS 279.74 TaxID=1314801 RepID=A0A6G1KJE6_9PLEO|nr:hypothetical protein K504DRAFT_488996 [Pleomassaria siparia CBS 279.74]
MPHGHYRLGGHDKNAPTHRPSVARPPNIARCLDCNTRESPFQSFPLPESCPHKREFAPTRKSLCLGISILVTDENTANRFSVLTNLDQQTNDTNWAFDFVPTNSHRRRRRGKRTGKNNKLNLAKPRPQGHGTSVTEVRDNVRSTMATLGLDYEDSKSPATQLLGNTQSVPPKTDFTFSTDVVKYPWMVQFNPNFLSDQSLKPQATQAKPVKPEKIELPLPRGLERPEIKSRESRFFPVSAFLPVPDRSACLPSSPRALEERFSSAGRRKNGLSIVNPSPAHKAATSVACRALATRRRVAPAVATSLGPYDPRPASPSPLGQTTIPITPPITPDSSPTTSPFAPMAITPSLAASPTLTTSPTISSLSSLASSPLTISEPRSLLSQPPRSPSFLPPRPLLTPTTPSMSHHWTQVSGDATPSSTSPLSLDSTLATPSVSSGIQSYSPPLSPKPSPPIVTTSLFGTTCVTKPPLSPVIEKQLVSFLKLGHGNPCWCTAHGHWQLPPQPLPEMMSSQTLKEREHRNASDNEGTTINLEQSIRRNHTRDEFSEVSDAPSSVCSSTMSAFENLDFFPRSEDSEHDTDEDWTIVSNEERYGKPSTANKSTSTEAANIISLPPSDGRLSKAIPPPSSHTAEIINVRPSSSSRQTLIFPTPAETSSIEWPTLQEAAMGLQSRRAHTRCEPSSSSSTSSRHSRSRTLDRNMDRGARKSYSRSSTEGFGEDAGARGNRVWEGIWDWV